jgi:hypothetical protein
MTRLEEPMMPGHDAPVTTPPRRHAAQLTDAVLESMRANLEQLKFSTLAPSRYIVYLHPTEHQRLEGILPLIRQQTVRALAEELESLNRPGRWTRLVPRPLARPAVAVERASDWHVEFVADANGELQEGDILVESQLLLPAHPELGIGEHTRKVTTRVTANSTATGTARRTEPVRALARLTWEDSEGQHAYEMVKPVITIGRGRHGEPADVRIASSADVSRLHARVRYVSATGQFFITDLSAFGTSVNRQPVPRGYDDAEGTRSDNGQESALPHQARIGLADTVYLSFDILGR